MTIQPKLHLWDYAVLANDNGHVEYPLRRVRIFGVRRFKDDFLYYVKHDGDEQQTEYEECHLISVKVARDQLQEKLHVIREMLEVLDTT